MSLVRLREARGNNLDGVRLPHEGHQVLFGRVSEVSRPAAHSLLTLTFILSDYREDWKLQHKNLCEARKKK